MKLSAYLRCMRFHKPVGTFLLWFPTAWALWVANTGSPPWRLVFYFFLGTFVMRSAGCVVNDMADRRIDPHVSRTCTRPIAAGELSVFSAGCLLVGLLFLAFLIVMQLPLGCFYEALLALLITLLYPFCKRFFQAPQFVLGFAFSMGIPMAYTASYHAFDASMWVLLVINFIWIVAYDTVYAMMDRDDDLRIGVKSTAILFMKHDRFILGLLLLMTHGLWLFLAFLIKAKLEFYVFWCIAGLFLFYQQKLISHRTTKAYAQAFALNVWYGLFLWVGLALQGCRIKI